MRGLWLLTGALVPCALRRFELQYALEESMLKRTLMLSLVIAATMAVSAPWGISAVGEERVPAYHQGPPPAGAKLSPILGKEQLWGENGQHLFQSRAYQIAAKIQPILYQMPCYCYCDRMGHKSLHSCFENTHGAQCATCMKEVFYAYQMSKQRKTAAQIRKGIIAGEWQQIDLDSAAKAN